MTDDPFAHLSMQHTLGDQPIPDVIAALAGDAMPGLAWRNELGGLTFRVGSRFAKWNPRTTGVDLDRERRRLLWLASRHPVPGVVGFGEDADAQWLLLAALPVGDFPDDWTAEVWVGRTPANLGPRPSIDHPVLVHGDACAPNTMVSDTGAWTGNVDFGDLAVGDRWADLAIASLSLDWNFGEGHQQELFDAYGIEPDHERIRYYRALWEQES